MFYLTSHSSQAAQLTFSAVVAIKTYSQCTLVLHRSLPSSRTMHGAI